MGQMGRLSLFCARQPCRCLRVARRWYAGRWWLRRWQMRRCWAWQRWLAARRRCWLHCSLRKPPRLALVRLRVRWFLWHCLSWLRLLRLLRHWRLQHFLLRWPRLRLGLGLLRAPSRHRSGSWHR